VVDTGGPGLLPQGLRARPPAELYRLVEVTPTRIDLIDERAGWGHRETLDLCAHIRRWCPGSGDSPAARTVEHP
jgi:hypothetical protein